MLTRDFGYHLPQRLIAQRPLASRDASRMLVLSRSTGDFEDDLFEHFAERLNGDELVVFNNARVIPARLFGSCGRTARVEVFLTHCTGGATWQVLVRPGRRIAVGSEITFGGGELTATVIARGERGERTVHFEARDARPVTEHLERLGHTPLPPYIARPDEAADRERYQTIFAKAPGAIAAPTAGLHFTPAVVERLHARGIETRELTLEVGLGTFQPVRTERLEEHPIHSESYAISEETAERVRAAIREKRRVVAIGTTAMRALEDAAVRAVNAGREAEVVLPGRSDARIFIYPGFRFRIASVLLTNFHLPRSTLLALVAAFAGREHVLAAYRHAVEAGYRFYSYGDCMLLL